MPCSDGGPSGVDLVYIERAELNGIKNRLNSVTAMLCDLLQSHPRLVKAGTELADWWAEHQEADRQRKEAEAKILAEAKARAKEKQAAEEAKEFAEYQRLHLKFGKRGR